MGDRVKVLKKLKKNVYKTFFGPKNTLFMLGFFGQRINKIISDSVSLFNIIIEYLFIKYDCLTNKKITQSW